MMNGAIEWGAIPYVVEMLGIRDVETLIEDLATIREVMADGNAP